MKRFNASVSVIQRPAVGRWAAVVLALVAGPGVGLPVGASDPPAIGREFRAAWIATVANIDWPSRPGLPADRQRAELVALLDRAVATRLNAVILQVRPCADALYDSPLEPWSAYLSGTMGQAPEPFYDPLAFAIEAAHARGLELHCWFNPYRVRHSAAVGPAAATHASVSMPDVVRQYGPFLWFDPGEPEAAERFLAVVRDVVGRYDIDGVHIDDYFYPYPVKEEGREVPFPDDTSHARAVAAGGLADRAAWRRDNVDRLVERLWTEVKREKPHVLVGISPFGIWRPGHPPGIKGLDQVAALHADPRKWLREGWLDYLAPQLYWRTAPPEPGFEKLLGWWVGENVRHRGLWPGLATSRVRQDPAVAVTATAWDADEILRQVAATRAEQGVGGAIHFSIRAIAADFDGVATKLAAGPYAEPALVPAIRPPHGPVPLAPAVARNATGITFALPPGARQTAWLWAVRSRSGATWQTTLLPGRTSQFALAADVDEVLVSAVARDGREGPVTRLTTAVAP
ncbi:MAG: glycoside hydrolase family 10 protein [Planctomycetota bacterium]